MYNNTLISNQREKVNGEICAEEVNFLKVGQVERYGIFVRGGIPENPIGGQQLLQGAGTAPRTKEC